MDVQLTIDKERTVGMWDIQCHKQRQHFGMTGIPPVETVLLRHGLYLNFLEAKGWFKIIKAANHMSSLILNWPNAPSLQKRWSFQGTLALVGLGGLAWLPDLETCPVLKPISLGPPLALAAGNQSPVMSLCAIECTDKRFWTSKIFVPVAFSKPSLLYRIWLELQASHCVFNLSQDCERHWHPKQKGQRTKPRSPQIPRSQRSQDRPAPRQSVSWRPLSWRDIAAWRMRPHASWFSWLKKCEDNSLNMGGNWMFHNLLINYIVFMIVDDQLFDDPLLTAQSFIIVWIVNPNQQTRWYTLQSVDQHLK
jgi:hypothetical protein